MRLLVLTEVHVLTPEIPGVVRKKFIWRGFYSNATHCRSAVTSPSTKVTGKVIDLR